MILSPSHSPMASPKSAKNMKSRFETDFSLTVNETLFTGFINTIKTISINNIPKMESNNREFDGVEEYVPYLSINCKQK